MTGAAVVLAVVGGVGIGLLANGGDGGGDGGARGDGPATEGEPVTEGERATQVTLGDLISAPRLRVPIVGRAATLGPSEAALLAAAAQARDARADAKAQRDEPVPGEASLSLAPISSGDRYRYLRRIGAVAVILEELGENARRLRSSATLELAVPQLRRQLDRLAGMVGALNVSPYLRSQRLHTLIEVTIARLNGLVNSDRPDLLRRLGGRLQRIGQDLDDELESAAAAARAGDQVSARRLLASADRRLGDIAAPL